MISQTLSRHWKLKKLPDGFAADEASIAAELRNGDFINIDRMPAQVQDILFQNGQIVEPWLPGKAEEYKWIAQSEWMYVTEFFCDCAAPASKLVFGGIDTVAYIYLNGILLGKADDCYIPWEFDVTGRLGEKNILCVYFPAFSRVLDEVAVPEPLAGRMKKHEFIRKMYTDYSRYLGPNPYFIKVGIFRDVDLVQYDTAGFENVSLYTSLDETLTKGSIHYEVRGRSVSGRITITAKIKLEDKACYRQELELDYFDGQGAFNSKGVIYLDNPMLWWPRGFGYQSLYTVEFEIEAGGQICQTVIKHIGFRRIVSPKPYRFLINNRHITLMGGNFAPLDSVTLCWDKNRASQLLDMAELANFNVMRVWASAGPIHEHLYDECDRRGILLWRDLNNSDMINEYEPYAGYILREAEIQINRLKHHASILLWCGGNESYLWANRKRYGDGYMGRKTVLKLKEISERFDPDRYFVESSPCLGNFPNDPQGGNTHGYTNMWFVPGYEHLVFATEDTRISAPCYRSVKRFFAKEDIWPENYSPVYKYGNIYPWPESWNNYTATISHRKVGPIEEFYDADNAEELIYRLGAAHALYYRRIIENFRQGKDPENKDAVRNTSGYLVWKLNDSWPQIYSAKVDYFLEPHIPYYVIKRAYEPLMVSFEIGNYVYAWVCNDSGEGFTGTLKIELFDMVKNCIVEQTQRLVSVKAGDSAATGRLDEFQQFSRDLVLVARLYNQFNDVVASTVDYTEIERRLTFPDARLSLSRTGDALQVTTDKFAKCIELSGNENGDEFGWLFEDNYFDLVPGEVKQVRIYGPHRKGIISAKAHYSDKVTQLEL